MAKSIKKIVLFDAHAIIHRAYHALPEFSSSKGEPTGGLYGVATMLIRIISEIKPDYLAACFDRAEATFRKQVYEGYKAGRKKAEDELVAQLIRARDIFAAFNIPIFDSAGFEADDIIGTIVEQLKKEKNLQIIIARSYAKFSGMNKGRGKDARGEYTALSQAREKIYLDAFAKIDRGTWFGQIIPLPRINAKFDEDLQVFLALDTLGHGEDAVFLAKGDDKFDDTALEGIFSQFMDDMPVDLDHFRLRCHDRFQTRVSTTDVIHREFEPIFPITIQIFVKNLEIRNRRTLRDFQDDVVDVNPAFLENGFNDGKLLAFDQIGVAVQEQFFVLQEF